MITIGQLFAKRVRNEWLFQIRVWRSVIDWTVALYIVIPLLIISTISYVSIWKQPPEWMHLVSLPFILLMMYGFAFMGTVRLFVEEADQLVLWQRPGWLTGLKKRGVIYSLITFGVSSVLFYLLVLPIVWNVYDWNLMQVLATGIFLYITKVHLTLLRQQIELRYRGFQRIVSLVLLFFIGAVLFFTVIWMWIEQPLVILLLCGCLLISLVQLVWQRIYGKHSFIMDVQREQKEKLRYVTMLLGQAQVIEKKSWFMPTGPVLFRRSKPLFKQRTPKNILTEFYIKAFFRKWKWVQLYLQMIGITVAAVVFSPIWLKPIVGIGVALMFGAWLNSFCQEVQSSSYAKRFSWNLETKYAAITKAVFLMMLPWSLVVFVVTGILLLI